MKFYDLKNQRLIHISNHKVRENFWNNLWLKKQNDLRKIILNFKPKSLVCKITKRFLNPTDGIILEGGCGLGDKVYSLKKLSYYVIGVDNAEKIIRILIKEVPEIEVKLGDVRALLYSNEFFIG